MLDSGGIRAKVRLLFVAFLIGIGVAGLYMLFERSITASIDTVWLGWIDTEHRRLLTVVALVVFGLVFFAAQNQFVKHATWFDSHRVVKLFGILVVGFLSLFSGATLGPEAVLIPSCALIAQLIARPAYKREVADIFGVGGYVALFVAFLNSPWAGLLGFLAAHKMLPKGLGKTAYVGMVLTALSAYGTLTLFNNHSLFDLPKGPTLSVIAVALYVSGVVVGLLYHRALIFGSTLSQRALQRMSKKWYVHWIVGSLGLGGLYLAGGYLMQFTGTETLSAMFQQSSQLGWYHLLWLGLVKTVAIIWCLRMGYRGGAIFPLMFVGASIAAIALLYTQQFSPILLALSFLVGIMIADRKAHMVTGSMAAT